MRYPNGAVVTALLFAVSMLALFEWVLPTVAQMPPSGQPVLNQVVSAVLLTPSDSATIKPTRGLHIGDGSPCSRKVMFSNDAAAVTVINVQPGVAYPYSIKQLFATGGTTCSVTLGLY